MPTIRISDEPKPCFSPDHNPPTHMYYPPGTYKHTCSSCGHSITFTVMGFYCSTQYSTIKQFSNNPYPYHTHYVKW